MLPAFELHDWMAPIIFVTGGFLAGAIVERLALRLLSKLVQSTQWMSVETLRGLLKGIIFRFFVLMGFYLATFSADALTEGFLLGLRKVIFVVAMLIAVRFVANAAIAVVRFYLHRSDHLQSLPTTSIFVNLTRIIIFGLGALVILQSLGVSVLPIVTALGVGGLAISLALQDTLANFFAGIHIIMSRQIKVGDFVRLEGGQDGVVADIGWRNTTLKQTSGNLIIVPNTKMASNILTRFAQPLPEMVIKIESAVAYGSDLEQVETTVKDIATDTLTSLKGVTSGADPVVRFHTFAEPGIQFSTILQVKKSMDAGVVRHEFLKRLYMRFQQEGIEIPLPQQRIVPLESLSAPEAKTSDSSGTAPKTKSSKAAKTQATETELS